MLGQVWCLIVSIPDLAPFLTFTLINQSVETVEKQHSMLCYRGGLIIPLMHVALIEKYASKYVLFAAWQICLR